MSTIHPVLINVVHDENCDIEDLRVKPKNIVFFNMKLIVKKQTSAEAFECLNRNLRQKIRINYKDISPQVLVKKKFNADFENGQSAKRAKNFSCKV